MILNKVSSKNDEVLILRKPIIEDAKSIIEYLNKVGGESDNLLFGKDEFHLTEEQEMEYINKVNKDTNALMILGLINNEIVGIAQVYGSNRKRIVHNSEIAISVRKKYWSVGIGSAIMSELIRFARESGKKNISLGVKANNQKALKLYEKFGFQKIGIHKDYFNINGTYHDKILMMLQI